MVVGSFSYILWFFFKKSPQQITIQDHGIQPEHLSSLLPFKASANKQHSHQHFFIFADGLLF